MRRLVRSVSGAIGIVTVSLLLCGEAAAQSPPSTEPGAATEQPSEAKKDEARQRYQRGLQLFNEANYEAARVEFERAYQLAPSYKILYNIGLCYEQLGDYVQAQSTLQRYLEIGGREISEERRSEVAKELAQIRPRIARVTIRTNAPGAEVLVDDVCSTDANTGNVNCGAFEGNSRVVLMNPGRRRITLRKEGYLPETQAISVAGSDQTEITINLKPLPKEYQEKKTNPFIVPMWLGWGVTAAALIGGGVTGILAANAKDDQEATLARFGSSRDELDSARDKTQTLSGVTDALFIGSGVAAAVATYFTIRAASWKGGSSSVNVEVGANRIGVAGQF